MKILIISLAGDPHAIDVAVSLRLLGHKVILWAWPSIAGQTGSSVYIKNGAIHWKAHGKSFPDDYFDVIWFRRLPRTILPDYLHAEDKEFALRENMAFYRGLWSVTSSKTVWLHNPETSALAENKFAQLKFAAETGFKIPDTVISNNVEDIHKFVNEATSLARETIYKTFTPVAWGTMENTIVGKASPVTVDDLRNHSMVSSVPGIYQEKLSKAFEVRANFFGDTNISISIDSQSNPRGVDDWRGIFPQDLKIKKIELPRSVETLCRQFMAQMQLKITIFDFVVNHNNEYIFLEINQQGQFLWIEGCDPSIPMLKAFVNFIVALPKGNELTCGERLIDIQDICLASIESMKICQDVAHAYKNDFYVNLDEFCI